MEDKKKKKTDSQNLQEDYENLQEQNQNLYMIYLESNQKPYRRHVMSQLGSLNSKIEQVTEGLSSLKEKFESLAVEEVEEVQDESNWR